MKPWEQTWMATEHGTVSAGYGSILQRDPSSQPDIERARLASAAPDMARVLLAIEWSGVETCESEGCTFSACPSCRGFDPHVADYDAFRKGESAAANRARIGHRSDCELDAALRKAGVRAVPQSGTENA